MTYSFPTRLSTDVGELVGHHVVELVPGDGRRHLRPHPGPHAPRAEHRLVRRVLVEVDEDSAPPLLLPPRRRDEVRVAALELARSEEHTSELQSLMRISYAVFCLKKKTTTDD